MENTITKKSKIYFFIPLAIVIACLLYSLSIFAFTEIVAVFRHYIGLLLFLPILYFCFIEKKFKKAIVLFGIYLVLASFNVLSFFPSIITNSVGVNIGGLKIMMPGVNGNAFGILFLYAIINFDTLVNIYLDYKEAKGEL